MLRTAPALIVAFALFVSLLPAVLSAEDPLLDRYIEAGERALQQGRHVTAEEMFLSAIKRAEALGPSDPLLIRSLSGLAEAYRAQGKDALAEPVLARIATAQRATAASGRSSGPTQTAAAAAAHRRAQRYLYGGDAARATGIWQEALRSHPDDTEMLTALAAVLYANGQYATAVPHAERAARLRRDDWTLRLFLGTVLREAGEDSRARDEFRAVVSGARPRGLVEIASKKLNGQFYRERDAMTMQAHAHPAARLSPGQTFVGELVSITWAGDFMNENHELQMMARALFLAGSQVFGATGRPATLNPGGDYFDLYAAAAGSTSEAPGWVHFHAFAYSTNSFLVTLHAWRGTTEERDLARLRNQYGVFDFFLQHVRAQYTPGRLPLADREQLRLKLRAYGAAGREQYGEAAQHLTEALRIASHDAHARCDLGHAYGRSGRWADAERELVIAVRSWPDYAAAHAHLGVARFFLGRQPEGLEQLKKAVELRPSFADAYFMRAVFHAIRKEGAAAEELLAQFQEVAPDEVEALRARIATDLAR
jgi:Flp pilus assembly protein TadD